MGMGSRDLLVDFWGPLRISGTGEARNFEFGTPIQNAIYPRRSISHIETGSVIPIWQMSVYRNKK